jgi:hypothetical protein
MAGRVGSALRFLNTSGRAALSSCSNAFSDSSLRLDVSAIDLLLSLALFLAALTVLT